MNKNVCIIDYGMGNIGSILNMLKYLGITAFTSSNPNDLKDSSHIILPGVGKFDAAMKNLIDRRLIKPLQDISNDGKIPIMGICLGMQILCNKSEEGKLEGLGLIDAEVKLFNHSNDLSLKVPHMGWNYVDADNKELIFKNIESPRFYFVHSYYVSCNEIGNVIGKTNYGKDFVSAFKKGKTIGLQFHPEKSHKYGMQIFKNFFDLQ